MATRRRKLWNKVLLVTICKRAREWAKWGVSWNMIYCHQLVWAHTLIGHTLLIGSDLVNLESRYGICFEFGSTRALILANGKQKQESIVENECVGTVDIVQLVPIPSLVSSNPNQLPNTVNDQLMEFASSNRAPDASVFFWRSLPAKSTMFNLPTL